MKKFIIAITAVMLCVAESLAHDVEIDGIYYNLDEINKTAIVTYSGNYHDSVHDEYSGSVTIPEIITYNSEIYSVAYIGEHAFFDCNSLTSVTIPNSVTSIGQNAFSGCSGLTEILVSSNNDEFLSENGVLYNKSKTTLIKYPAGKKDTSFTIPNSVTSIGDYAFYDCSGLTSVTIPNSVMSIGSWAFADCSGLTSVTIGESVTSISERAFYNCSGLTKVNYLGTVDKWVEIDFEYYSYSNPTYYAKDLYINNELLTDVKITTADSIKNYAFYNCQSIKFVEIGNSVTTIGSSAFEDCSGLTKVNYLGTVDEWVDIDFQSKESNPTYYAKDLYINNELLTDVKIITVNSIKDYAFYNCQSIKSVEIGESVTSIGGWAFSYCSGLTSVAIPNSVTSISHDAFNGTGIYNNESNWDNGVLYIDSRLIEAKEDLVNGSYIIKEGTRFIGEDAFSGCRGLTSVTIPTSVTSIGDGAFYNCSGLTKVNYLGTVDKWVEIDINGWYSNPTYYAKDLYINNELLTGVKITTVDSIKNYAFNNCQSIKYVEIGESVTSIGDGAFYNCSGLTKVNYLGTVDEWVEIDFNYSNSNPTYYAKDLYIDGELLTDVKITSADSIKDYSIDNCKSIKSVEIGNSVKYIGKNAFQGSNITHIEIPDNVESIGAMAFSYTPLTSIHIGKAVKEIGPGTYDKVKMPPLGGGSKYFPNFKEIIVSPENNFFASNDGVLYNKNMTELITFPPAKTSSYEIPNIVTSIGDGAFYGCNGVTSVTIPNSVSSIGYYAFGECSGLTKVNYLGTVDEWVDIDFVYSGANPTTFRKDLYINNELLTDVKITTADSIKDYAFYNCQSIKSVIIGNSVTSIGEYAFTRCSGLTSVIIPNSITYIDNSAFGGCDNLKTVYNCSSLDIVKGSTSNGYVANYADEVINACPIGDFIVNYEDEIIEYIGDTTINKIEIPEFVTGINADVFTSCANIDTIVWNAINCADFTETTAPFNAQAAQIKSVIFGNDVEYIPAYLCSDMTLLTEISIPGKVNSIGENAFVGCSRLRYITSYPTLVPLAKENSFNSYSAYLYVPCDYYDYYYLDDVFGKFKEIKCISAEEVEGSDKVEIEVDSNNNATIIWPSTGNANSYELVISKNGEVFCTLLFNENGQLTSIDFGNRSASVGFQFTVKGLDGASKYSYSIVAKDEKGNELESYNGTFTTNGYSEVTAILETLTDANITVSGGTISADTDFTIYNTIGQNVTAQNGSLTPGVYVVKVADDIAKVMVQ